MEEEIKTPVAENTAPATESTEATAAPAAQSGKGGYRRNNKFNDRGGNNRGKGPRGKRGFRQEEKEFEDRVVKINRITKVVKGGKKTRFSALVVIGDKKGRVGFGTGKANEVPDAIRKATADANHHLMKVQLVGTTLPHEVVGHYGAGSVLIRPAADGTGVIAGGAVRAVLELAGVSNVLTKCIGSRTPINAVRATFDGLAQMKTIEEVSELRGLKPSEVRH